VVRRKTTPRTPAEGGPRATPARVLCCAAGCVFHIQVNGRVSQVASGSFAELLRRHRLKAGLTQEALANLAGLSAHGIQRLESGASRPYRETIRRLVQALRLSREDATALQDVAPPAPRHRTSRAGTSPADIRHSLPAALTSFIGRELEKDELARLLAVTRLLTLTGVGGCGKTRLALEVCRLVYDTYPDGVWLVELASITDPALIPQAVATAVGVRETPAQSLLTTLSTTLEPRQTLLVLDNCEHLLDACAHLANTLLLACPRLQILATSREALGVAGEVSRRVPSLQVPPPESPPTAEAVGRYAAVQLFVERARAVQPTFAIAERTAATIGQVCQRLDGIPLALELAAALLRGLSVDDLATRLDQRFQLLTGGNRAALPRQQTLRATIDWSYGLLTEAERALFARLAVFAGSWDLEAAEAVCAGDGVDREEVVQLLLHLVDKSLVAAEEQVVGKRYRLLDTLRQYARETLLARGESEHVHGRHANYYATLADTAEPELDQPRQAAWIDRLALEQSEFRAAVEWLVARGAVQQALQLAGVMSRFWEVRGQLREGRARLAGLLALPGASARTVARAKVLDGAAVLALYQFDIPTARALFKESLALYREHHQLRGVSWVLIHLGWLCHDLGRPRAAQRFLQEALALCRQVDDRRGVARCLTILGMLAFDELDLRIARSMYEESLALNREVGDRWGTAWTLLNFGRVRLAEAELGLADTSAAQGLLEESVTIWREIGERRHLAFASADLAVSVAWQGDLALARTHLEEALSTFAELQDKAGNWSALFSCSRLLATDGQYEQSARLLGAARAGQFVAGRPIACFSVLAEHRLESLRRIVGPELVATAFAQGAAMSLDEAVALAYFKLGRLPKVASNSR
jgi:predicted ATPase/DNA-binding XRE family transcriptional regulator